MFISFFPHLVAGPIQRASFLLPQVEARRGASRRERARSGFVLICWGFFKKLVIADNVGVIANKVFALRDPTFYILWAGVFAFAIQIYADFSAYTDIARGTSRWLGFELTQNFDHPVPGAQPRRFLAALEHLAVDVVPRLRLHPARRIARQPARCGRATCCVTFLLSGFWHGASWNYVLWGVYHGVLLVADPRHGTRRPAAAPPAASGAPMPQIAGMFALTLIGWLLFRETELAAIVRDLRLSPFGVAELDRQTGALSVPARVRLLDSVVDAEHVGGAASRRARRAGR